MSGAIGAQVGSGARNAAADFTRTFESEANSRASRVGSTVGKALGYAVVGAAGAATAGLGAILFKGLDRYKSLDATAKRLGNMGKSADEVRSIMGDINDVIDGTPVALDAASKSAAQFLSGGVKQGKELKDVLTAIADASGFANEDFDALAQGFIQVKNQGKLTAEEIQNQFRNLPIIPWLAKSMGTDPASVKEMISNGKVGINELVAAVEAGAGGMAKSAADTVDGALSQLTTSVSRLGSNFLSAIFGDPLSTTEGPGAMAEAINNITNKLNNVNNWVTAHQAEIKQFFTDAAQIAGNLADVVVNIADVLREHPGLIYGVVGAFAAWKTIEGVAALTSSLKAVSTLMKVTLPADAAAGAAAVGASWGPIAAMLGGILIAKPYLEDFADKHLPQPNGAPHGFVGLDLLGGLTPSAQTGPSGPMPPGYQAANPLDAISGKPTASSNPSNGNTGGLLTPETQNIQNYLRNSLGFKGTIGGWRPPDGYNEHSSGKASDVMVSSAAEGNALLPNLLRQPGVQYILWQQKTWYPDGSSKPMEDRGSPTQNHMDHLHVKTFQTGGPVSGKPGPDQIMAWLTDGEHVWTADEVAAVGGQEKMLQLRQMAQAGQLTPDMISGMPAGGAGNATRTEGYIPAAAGNTAPVGGGVAGSLLGLGNQAVAGLIDQAAAAGSMGANMFAPGSGQAVQMGAQAAKRAVQYGFDMANIGIGAAAEILLPFGAPRWLSDVSPTSFVPQWGVQGAGTTTAEQAVLDQQSADPNTTQHGTAMGAPPGPPPPAAPVEPDPNGIPQVVINGGINGVPPDQVAADIESRQRLLMMQNAGRPYG